MGLKIGKAFGRIAHGLIKNAPSIISGFASGGPGGGALATLGGLRVGGGGPGAGPGAIAAGTGFVQPSSSFPSSVGGGRSFPVKQDVFMETFNKSIFDIALKVLDKLGVLVRNPNRVKALIRSVLAKMIRFARATPGLTIVSMLISLGLTAFEANQLVSWYTTAGKRRRRIRVTNVKALNRSIRRLTGFMRLSHRVQDALARKVAVLPGRRLGRRALRCRRCGSSPCCCK